MLLICALASIALAYNTGGSAAFGGSGSGAFGGKGSGAFGGKGSGAFSGSNPRGSGTTECTHTPVTCGEDEMMCMGGIDAATGCPKPDTCVAQSYVNEQNHTCWNSCPMTCESDQLFCPGQIDQYTGCHMGDMCMWQNPDSNCPAKCPVYCNYETEYHCGGEDANGCWEDKCCAKTFGNDGMECPYEYSMTCDEPNVLCVGEVDSNGCKQSDSCMWHDSTSSCPASCPVTCDYETQYHYYSYDANGCMEQSCRDITYGTDGTECPHDYDMMCDGENNVLCPGGTDSNGCKQPDHCMWNDPDSTCPASCPVTCGNDQLHCPGQMGADGCPLTDTCVDNPAYHDPEACHAFCPTSCGEDSYECPSMDGNGCPMMGWCKHKQDNCPDMCPMSCSGDQMHCPEYDANGCEMAGTCVANGESCPSDAADMTTTYMPTTGCPVIDHACPNEGEIYCYGGWDEATQCEMQGSCAAPVGDCPAMCSMTCSPDEIVCPGQIDHYTGCQMPDTCMWNDPASTCQASCYVMCNPDTEYHCGSQDANGCWQDKCCPKTFGNDGMECMHVYSQTCASGDITCPGGIDSNGCQVSDSCVPDNGDSNCPATCPITCDHDTQYHCGSTDANGCWQDQCCDKTYGNDGNECYHSTSMTCTSEEITCPGGLDWNGCEMGDFCMWNDSNCPASCPVTCDYDTQYHCGDYTPDGCWTDACCDKTFGNDGTECPYQYSMPCDGEEWHQCDGWVDDNGCQQTGSCMWIDPNSSCPLTCPAQCNYDTEHHCGSTDSNGCWVDACCPNETSAPRQMDENMDAEL